MATLLPTTAMVLAAGLGLRMRPLTLSMPKPLIEVAGRALIDRVLDTLAEAGIERAVVNVHHLADQLIAHLERRSRPTVIVSDERDGLLDSGGGVVKALPQLGDTFLVLNADSFWLDRPGLNLKALAANFDPEAMDARLLLADRAAAIGFDGAGDFFLEPDGRLKRRGAAPTAPLVYAGGAVMTATLFEGAPAGPFKLTRMFDRAQAAGRLHGQRLDGLWLHVGTPPAIALAEAAIAAQPHAAS
ncbi:nucleotidyltransferase family protein [Blastochloris viridis]|uniref:Bifunctional N-acetylglucosamine-1-phosphate uridyltransferase/glucosamine-1-phosphate acetyltransferase n=1 Tax=Blastochloris viridis TaxID=1079 RepID=A0A0H5BFD3_BLAVI|nr:nucleotidyltransferase family protein [Blastochloris viridis]ALK10950.1 Bifunctional IPC transferase and DIPP synthase [Blastochloris viridis]BAR99066.1 nucleotidyltransferase [Blastochloris viridis]CUU43612.1 bifunctional N-acetylglucosamine-1-phosphate uridyltransferase/glucosamine-1-phosphate acetyltransferase [Blastochloris viridis]